MVNALISWIGRTDLRASAGDADAGVGPLGQAVDCGRFDEFHLISNYASREVNAYLKWLRARTKCRVVAHEVKLSGPTNFEEIYEAAVRVVTDVLKRNGPEETRLTFHLSPGTPAMAAVFVILAKTRFNAELIQTSKEKGMEYASVPFEFSAFVPDLLRRPYAELTSHEAGFELPRPLTPDQLVEYLRRQRGYGRAGEEELNNRAVVKYVAARETRTGARADDIAAGSVVYIDKLTGLPLRTELVSEAAGGVEGVRGLRVVAELRHVRAEAERGLFAVPRGMEKVGAEEVRREVDSLVNTAAGLAGSLLDQTGDAAFADRPATAAR